MVMSINPVDLAAAAEGILNTQYLQQRERLLAASAQASRLLLEAPHAMEVMPEVLRLLGEAAQVDRTALAFAESGPNGEKWLKIQAEWINETLAESCADGECDGTDPWNEPRSDRFCNMLQSGKSVVFCPEAQRHFDNASITSDKARTSAIVPILVDGDYVGVIGFDDWQRVREFDSSIVSALEIAAGLVGAALHRERLLDTMRRDREIAAEERLSSAMRANALLRSNLTRLARDADPKDFVTNILLDATRQLDAAAAFTIGFDKEANLWRAFCHVENGQVSSPPYQTTAKRDETRVLEVLEQFREPSFHKLAAAGPHPVARRRRLAHARRPQERLSSAARGRRTDRGLHRPRLPRERCAHGGTRRARARGGPPDHAVHRPQEARHGRQGSGGIRRAQPHRPGNP